MRMRRSFLGQPVKRWIVSVPEIHAELVDLIAQTESHPARGCRAEFVRLAIQEKLEREKRAVMGRLLQQEVCS